MIAGDANSKGTRFVKTTPAGGEFDEVSLEKARSLVGLKGYVTNIEAAIMPAAAVLFSYHDLWHVEQLFRMSKTDLQASRTFHHHRDAIETRLTIVFTSLATARDPQDLTGISIRRIIGTVKPLLEVQVNAGGHLHAAAEPLAVDARHILNALEAPDTVGH